MSYILNGVDLDQEAAGKWWGFDLQAGSIGAYLHGWCAPEHRLELITAVTGLQYVYWIGGGSKATQLFRGSDTAGECDSLDVPTRLQGGLMMQNYPGPGRYDLSLGATTYAWRWASIYWGMSADGVNRFAFHFAVPLAATPVTPVWLLDLAYVEGSAILVSDVYQYSRIDGTPAAAWTGPQPAYVARSGASFSGQVTHGCALGNDLLTGSALWFAGLRFDLSALSASDWDYARLEIEYDGSTGTVGPGFSTGANPANTTGPHNVQGGLVGQPFTAADYGLGTQYGVLPVTTKTGGSADHDTNSLNVGVPTGAWGDWVRYVIAPGFAIGGDACQSDAEAGNAEGLGQIRIGGAILYPRRITW